VGGEAGKKNADALVEFGCSVVVREDGGKGPEAREVLCRQAVQAQAEECFVFFRIHDELLKFVEDVAVEEPVVGAVDMQCVLGCESCVDQQGQDLLERPQGAQRP